MSGRDYCYEHCNSPADTPQLLLEHHLKELRLPTILREYDKVARQCAAEQLDYQRYLLRMSELELLDRERRATERRIRQAKFPVVKSLDSFDFLAIPSLNKTLVLELARCEFLVRRENVLLLGNSGTGKTHVALALGLAACQRGHRVRFTTAAALVHELMEARDEKKLLRYPEADRRLRTADRRRTRLRAALQDRRGVALRGLQPALRAHLNAGHQQSALPGMDRGPRIGTAHRSPARSPHPPRSHPGDERRQLPAEAEPPPANPDRRR